MNLSAKDTVGSKIRCLELSQMVKNEPAILTKLVNLEKVFVPNDPTIIPCGRGNPEELIFSRKIAESFIEKLLDRNSGSKFTSYNDFKEKAEDWWLKHPKNANTPNWDIACIAEIHDRAGLILVEAKAHKGEFSRKTKKPSSDSQNSQDNNTKIISEITRASEEMKAKSKLNFNLNGNSPYQLSNRFAWSWFLAQNGIPVVLMYLGFIETKEMNRIRFESHDDVVLSVLSHCKGKKDDSIIYVPDKAWQQEPLYDDGNTTLYSVIRSMELEIGQATIVSINGLSV